MHRHLLRSLLLVAIVLLASCGKQQEPGGGTVPVTGNRPLVRGNELRVGAPFALADFRSLVFRNGILNSPTGRPACFLEVSRGEGAVAFPVRLPAGSVLRVVAAPEPASADEMRVELQGTGVAPTPRLTFTCTAPFGETLTRATMQRSLGAYLLVPR